MNGTGIVNVGLEVMLVKRILTAAVMLAVVVVSLWCLPFWVFRFLLAAVLLLAAWEYQLLFTDVKDDRQRINLIALLLVGFSASGFVSMRWLWIAATGWWLLTVPIVLYFYSSGSRLSWLDHRQVVTILAILMFVACFSAIVDLRGYLGEVGVTYLLSISIVADSAAYLIGRSFGRHKMAKVISPGKTIEGALAGLISVLMLALVCRGIIVRQLQRDMVVDIQISWGYWLSLTVVAVLAAILGDLWESMLNRRAGVKDSGSWLPGHGGFYDRIDSLLAVAPVLVLGILVRSFN